MKIMVIRISDSTRFVNPNFLEGIQRVKIPPNQCTLGIKCCVQRRMNGQFSTNERSWMHSHRISIVVVFQTNVDGCVNRSVSSAYNMIQTNDTAHKTIHESNHTSWKNEEFNDDWHDTEIFPPPAPVPFLPTNDGVVCYSGSDQCCRTDAGGDGRAD